MHLCSPILIFFNSIVFKVYEQGQLNNITSLPVKGWIERSRRIKSHSGLKLVSDSCTDNLIVSAILTLIHLNT